MERSAPVVALLLGVVAFGASCRSAPRVPDPRHERISGVTVIDEQFYEAARELDVLRSVPLPEIDNARRELAYPSLLPRYFNRATLRPLPVLATAAILHEIAELCCQRPRDRDASPAS
jgi:hypothetical protein